MKNSHLTPASLDEAAHFLAVSSRTVRRLIDSGALPCLRVGSALAVPAESLPGLRGVADADPDMRPLLRLDEASARLGCPPRALRDLTRSGALKSVHVGCSERWVPADIDAFARERAHVG
jgi:excisionase family DNA binding protein